MPRPTAAQRMVEAAREEALTAVSLLNSPTSFRPFSSYLMHMHNAWLVLLHAEFSRDRVPYHFKQANGRYVRVDGDRKAWDLQTSARVRWPVESDPVRLNVELTVKLRNKVEHRFEAGALVATAGFTHALLLNFEAELVAQFGSAESLGSRVHIPVSVSAFSRDGAIAMAKAQASLPSDLRKFIVDYRGALDTDVLNDRAFELRLDLVQKRSSPTDADLAVTFVREDQLTPEQIAAYSALEKTGRVIVREKNTGVTASGWVRPKKAAEAIQEKLGYRFLASVEFARAWKYFKVRPDSNVKSAKAKAQTDGRYCQYDTPHNDYLYSDAFVDMVVEECSDPAAFEAAIGFAPKPVER